MAITRESFGAAERGEEITRYRITNGQGAYIEILNYGAILNKVVVPDKNGKMTDVVLGFDQLQPYFKNPSYFGGTIGRNSNRIADAEFCIDGTSYRLADNENGNNLHSGPVGYNLMVWEERQVSQQENAVTFGRVSPDQEQGFPGDLDITVTYSFNDHQEVKIEYRGESSKKTVINLTNHSYFNLAGQDQLDVRGTFVQIDADAFTPVDEKLIPTGEIRSVENTPMDFRAMKTIGQDLENDDEQLALGGGYDHNYMLNHYQKGKLRKAAEAFCEATGISMEVETDLPGIQFYTGNAIDRQIGKSEADYGKYSGFCLETQYVPNGVNDSAFEAPVFDAGEIYHTVTVYRFGIRK